MGALERVYHTEEHIMMDKERRRYGEPLAYYKPISKTYRKSILEKVADDEVSILTSNIKSNNINYIASNIKSINGSFSLFCKSNEEEPVTSSCTSEKLSVILFNTIPMFSTRCASSMTTI